ncbi:GTA baseplate fiber-binding domain-containing protein [Jannaschia seosinensis]|uniref:GTA baseplate fiber-binding domain-containing protein n=1 Tax=Jannaschia seosinensis TaxID=313367 RepID=UPI0011874754|nr:hypothetical protein [Jannaschia seosinensis]
MARASYAASARAMALGALSLAWFCAAAWPVFTPPLTLWRIDRIEEGLDRRVSAVRTERELFEPSDEVEDSSGRVRPLAPLPVDALIMNLPTLRPDDLPHAPYVAVAGSPWPGSAAFYRSLNGSDYRLSKIVDGPSIIGETLTELHAARAAVVDHGPELLVRVASGSLASVEHSAFLAGANAAVIGDHVQDIWEIIQFRDVRLVKPNVWAIKTRLRGQKGTEGKIRSTWPIGSHIVMLDETGVMSESW